MQQVRALVGFKNTNTRYHYDQMTYAMYFYTEYVYIYEDGENRGYTGFGYSYNASYDVRIELKEEEGARYYYRPSGFSYWILVYDSDYSSAASFKPGADVHSGTFYMDDLKEIAAGKTPTYRFYSPGRHAIKLTVYDQAMQADTDSSFVIIQPFIPDAGDDQIVYDSVTLDGSASSYEDCGVIVSWELELVHQKNNIFNQTHFGEIVTVNDLAPGFYTVTLTVTDDHGFSDSDDMTLAVFGCKGDFDKDGDVDGSDLATFAKDFGRTNCPTCK